MKKRRKVKKNVLRNFIILLLVIGTGFYLYLNKDTIFNKNITPANNDKPNVIKEPEEIWPKETKVSFLATGDGLIHNTLANNALQKDGTYNFTGYLTEVKDIVQKYDIAYYNQETIFGGQEVGYSTYPRFNTQSEYGDAMLDAGFNTVSLASNHSNDKGTVAIENALKYWNSKEDIMFNGIFKNIEDKNNIMITEKNGIKYALLSYTYGLNGLNLPKGKEYMVNNYNNDANKLREMASNDIALIKDKVDVIMVAMHWGVEYTFTPTKYQKEQAKVLEELGVDIIIGNHPHTIQPIEWINDTLVIYSLGNFISNQIALKVFYWI
jgi:Putative enzyme of poly-gamma-glutamate biosynthesis (capsule formation)